MICGDFVGLDYKLTSLGFNTWPRFLDWLREPEVPNPDISRRMIVAHAVMRLVMHYGERETT